MDNIEVGHDRDMLPGEKLQAIQQLQRALVNPEVGTVVIYGIGGSGKTWTAKKAYNTAVTSHLFDTYIWIPLSSSCSVRRAMEKISTRLSIAVGADLSEESMRAKISESLEGRNFFLVLDNAWFKEDGVLDRMGVPRRNRLNASKVVATTRTSRSLNVMEPDIVITPTSLGRKDSWDLFREMTGESISSKVGPAVVEGCNGMPLPIILLAGAFRNVPSGPAMTKAQESAMISIVAAGPFHGMYRAVRFGYSMLPSDRVRDCFSFCLLFPEDIGIPSNDLIHYWIMDGLIDGGNDMEKAKMGRDILLVLLDHGMLYWEDDDHVRVHDVVREVALDMRIACKLHMFEFSARDDLHGEVALELHNLSIAVGGSCSRRSLMESTIKELCGSPKCLFISTLLLRGNHYLKVIQDSYFQHMQMLSVLDLSFTRIRLLPSSISNLVRLRLLILKCCDCLQEVRHIRPLVKLEILDASSSASLKKIESGSFDLLKMLKTLDLSGTSIEYLPSTNGLRDLRRLLLNGCRSLKSDWRLHVPPKLKILDLSNTTFANFAYGINTAGAFQNLQLGNNDEAINWEAMQWIQVGLTWDQRASSSFTFNQDENDATARISVSNASFFKSLNKDSPLWKNGLQKFHFFICPLEEESMDLDILVHSMQYVFRDTYLKTKHFSHSTSHSRFLEIHSSDSYPAGVEGILARAEVISLKNLAFLTRLSDLNLQEMRPMRECWIDRCNRMENVFSGNEIELIAAMGSLQNLWISNLEKLTSFCGGAMERLSNLSCLRHLHLDCCPNLTCLFPPTLRLQELETLQIKFCDNLQCVFDNSILGKDALPRLQTVRLWELPELTSVCGGVLPSIKNLEVKNCLKLKKIPVGVDNKSPLAVIRGERVWWNNVTWEDERIKSLLIFRNWGRRF
ncbi:probable disease resistance protein At1g61300 [Typha angustifolia]|uniref:probable disease resistance protein At1g61300 n=1 Tax=Typha angustifolia TaxID=59011 RepID=UPI003C2EB9DB